MQSVLLLRLLQLSSPSLPVGAYTYSQGLESAIEKGTVDDERSARAWITAFRVAWTATIARVPSWIIHYP